MSSSDHLLPPNATGPEKALANTVKRLSGVSVPVGDLWNPATCPAALLPWLAWALSVDIWDAGWSEAVKRQVIAESIAVHRKKGTAWAVRQAMAAAGSPDFEVREWFEYGGDPYYFRVDVGATTAGLSASLVMRLMADIAVVKNVRSWGSLRLSQAGELSPLFFRAATLARPRVVIKPYTAAISLTDNSWWWGCGAVLHPRVIIDEYVE